MEFKIVGDEFDIPPQGPSNNRLWPINTGNLAKIWSVKELVSWKAHRTSLALRSIIRRSRYQLDEPSFGSKAHQACNWAQASRPN